MKRIFTALGLTAAAFLACQCNKSSIDKPLYGIRTNQNFYQSDTDIYQALTGAYLQLRQTENEYSLYHYFLGDITTDDAFKGGQSDADNADLQHLSTFSTTSANYIVGTVWGQLYSLIGRTNEIIAYAPGVKGDKDKLTRYANEAKALRAFAYYQLVTLYGGVPLVLKPLSPQEATSTPRAGVDSVFQQIVTDLEDATALPSKTEYGDADKYRVSRGFAYAMLGKAYMFWGKYPEAVEAMKKLIDSHVYRLLPNYGDNWTILNSDESIFEINGQMTDNPNLETGSQIPLWFMSRNTLNYQGYGFDCPSTDLYNTFDPDDPRITYTFTRTGDTFKDDPQPQDNTDSPTGFHNRKSIVPYYKRADYYPNSLPYNVRFIRYSDILLLYAEALNETGASAAALTYLNQVRYRARHSSPLDADRSVQVYVPKTNPATSLPDVTTTNQDALRKAIWHERRCELALEGWRRDDLCRQKRFGEVMRAFSAKYNTTKGQGFDDGRDYLLPIPQTEVDYSNNVIRQNPGY